MFLLTDLTKLVNKVVFQNGTRCKVIPHIHKRRKRSRSEALDPLHGGCRRVSPERIQAAVWRLGCDRLPQHRQFVFIRSGCSVVRVEPCKVYLQGINNEEDSPAETWLSAAKVSLRLLSRVQCVCAAAGSIHLQPHQQEATYEKVDSHDVNGAHPEEKGQHRKHLHPGHRQTTGSYLHLFMKASYSED